MLFCILLTEHLRHGRHRKQGILITHGIRVASIGAIEPSSNYHHGHVDAVDNGTARIMSWNHLNLPGFGQAPTRLTDLERILLCDIPERVHSNTESWFLNIVDFLHGEILPANKDRDSAVMSRSSEGGVKRSRVEAIVRNIYKRSLFITDNGHLGMAQDSILEGDLVCVLFGCSISVILRRVDDHFIYISDACVVGYMYGKGIEELEAGKLQAETFEIH